MVYEADPLRGITDINALNFSFKDGSLNKLYEVLCQSEGSDPLWNAAKRICFGSYFYIYLSA